MCTSEKGLFKTFVSSNAESMNFFGKKNPRYKNCHIWCCKNVFFSVNYSIVKFLLVHKKHSSDKLTI